MPTYHRSQRLRLVGTGPKVEQLQEGRFRLTFTCSSTNPSEAWMQGNKSQIFAAYGTLESAEMSIAGIAPRTSEAYSDMVLFRTEANPSERDLIVTLIYETATTAFVKSQDDKIDFELNGLQRVTRVTIAKTGTSLPSVTIGTTSITVDGTACKLASRSVEENDAFIQITETYLQEGTVSKTQDNVGSQLAQVITTFGSDPAGISGYSIASKEESNFSGYQTNTFRFLKENVQLSKSVDNKSSLKTETREYFKPDSSKETLANYSLINKSESNVDGIPTERYTFAKDNQQISRSVDNQSPLLTETREYFKPDSSKETLSDYSLISKQESNVDGIPTERYTFAKNNVTLSTSEEKVGSQLAIVKEVFNGTPSTPSGYSIADEQVSNVDGIVTRRFRFLKNNVELSRSNDNVGSQEAIVRTFFNPTSDPTESGYSLAKKDQSDFEGIETVQYTFLRRDSLMSSSEDNVGSQKAIVEQWFDPTDQYIDAYVVEGSDPVIYDDDTGISGTYYLLDTQASGKVRYSRSTPSTYEFIIFWNASESRWRWEIFQTLVAVSTVSSSHPPTDPSSWTIQASGFSLKHITRENVSPMPIQSSELANFDGSILFDADIRKTKSGYSVAKEDNSNLGGIPTERYTFLKDNVTLSTTEDKVGSQLAIVKETFNGTPSTPSGYSIADESVSSVDGIPTRKFRFLKNSVTLSTSEDKIGSQLAIVKEVFNGTPSTPSGYSIADEQISSVDGIPTRRFRFLKDNVQLSRSVDNQSSLKTEVREYFKPDSSKETLTDYVLISKQESNVDGIPTERYTFAKPGIISTSVDLAAASTVVQIEKFGSTAPTNAEVNTAAGTSSETYTLVSKKITNLNGINTHSYTFTNTNSGIMISSKRVFEDGFTLKEAYQLSSETKTPEAIATDLATAASSGDTVALTPNITIPIDISTNTHHTLFLDTNEDLTSVPKRFSQVLINIDTGAGDSLSNGILVNKYQTHEIFNYPGEVDITQVDYGGNNDFSLFSGIVQVPITASIQSTVFEFIQTESSIQSSDYILNPDSNGNASGLWRPNNWGNYHVTILGTSDRTVFEESKQWKGYRIIKPSFKVKGTGFGTNIRWEGNQYIYNTSKGTFIFTSNPGPPSPVGSRWTLDVDISPIGLSAAGTPIFKKTVVITDPIPLQRANALPY